MQAVEAVEIIEAVKLEDYDAVALRIEGFDGLTPPHITPVLDAMGFSVREAGRGEVYTHITPVANLSAFDTTDNVLEALVTAVGEVDVFWSFYKLAN